MSSFANWPVTARTQGTPRAPKGTTRAKGPFLADKSALRVPPDNLCARHPGLPGASLARLPFQPSIPFPSRQRWPGTACFGGLAPIRHGMAYSPVRSCPGQLVLLEPNWPREYNPARPLVALLARHRLCRPGPIDHGRGRG